VSRARGRQQVGVSANSGEDCRKSAGWLEGRNDMLVPPENSCLLWQMLVNSDAYLHLYPDSGHGVLSEYHQHFAAMVNTFLDEPEREEEDWD
jgi:pimeloyl-ACP methyl ester carboxylesterase